MSDAHRTPVTGHPSSSVHLTDFPTVDTALLDEPLVSAMDEVRRLATLGLAARAEAKIKVRQPLQKIKIKNEKIKIMESLRDILKDEVNVKEIVFDATIANEVELDTVITPELREEGMLRELVRMVQELRQTANYKPGELAMLFADVPASLQAVLLKNLAQFKKETAMSAVEFKRSDKFDAEIATKFENVDVWLAVRR